jgi:hypothetical protein
MKTLLTFAIAALLSGFSLTLAQQNDFMLKIDNDTISNIKAGETAFFDINVITQHGFDASLGFTIQAPTLQGAVALSHSLINYPYKGLILTINPKEWYNYTDSYHRISIIANNGSISVSINCYVSIISKIAPLWKILPEYYRTKFIVQVDDSYYGYSFAHPGTGEDKLYSSIVLFGNGQLYYPPNEVFSITMDNTNKIWFATNAGLMRYDGKYFTQYNTKTSPIPDNMITAIVADDDGSIWVGTNKGLARLSGTEWTLFNSINSILGTEVITSIAVSGKTVWVGTHNGLAKFDGKIWRRFTSNNSTIPAPIVWSMAAEDNGNLWLGLGTTSKYDNGFSTFGGPDSMIGLAKFDGINWSIYNNQNSPMNSGNYINSIAIDKKGNKWIATSSYLFNDDRSRYIRGSGLLKFDNNSWTTYSTVNSPLPNNNVQLVFADSKDNIWFSTNRESGVFNENGLSIPLAPSAVEEQPAPYEGIHLYPNPTSTSFTLSGVEGVSSVRLVNSIGIEVKQLSIVNSQLSIDVSDLANGLYFVNIRTATGATVKPIMVSH